MVDRLPLVDLVGTVFGSIMWVHTRTLRFPCSTNLLLCLNSTKLQLSMVPLCPLNGSSRVPPILLLFIQFCRSLIQKIKVHLPRLNIWHMVIVSGLSRMNLTTEVWLWLWTLCFRSRRSRSWRPMEIGLLGSNMMTRQPFVGICPVKLELQVIYVGLYCIRYPMSSLVRKLLDHHLLRRELWPELPYKVLRATL